MGKQRTPQGRPAGRGRSNVRPPAGTKPAPGAVPDLAPVQDEAALRAHLMDSVSSEALGAGAAEASDHAAPSAGPVAAAPVDHATDRSETSVADTAAPEPEPVSEPNPRALALVSSLPADAPGSPVDPVPPTTAPSSSRTGAAARREPIRHDIEGMGETLFAFLRNESTAVVSHLQALGAVRSPADAIRLQVTELQRAADASLTCWSNLARRAGRIVAHR